MDRSVWYVLGGPVDRALDARRALGLQPLAEFNVFVERNGALLCGTELVAGGSAVSLRRRLTLARALLRREDAPAGFLASGEDIGFPLALLSAARTVRPTVWIIVHGSYLGSRRFGLVAPLLRRCRHVRYLCLSGAIRDLMIGRHGFSPGVCHNAGYGVDTEFFAQMPASGEGLVVAAGMANRDYATLIEAVRGLEVRLRIAADSLWRPDGSVIERGALPPNVVVASAGDHAGLRDLYRQSRFVVVPLHQAHHASGYAVIAEAMATGRAVITTMTDAPSDLVVDGETGFYVPAGDGRALRGRMEELIRDPARAAAMGCAGARRMRERFGLGQYCETMEGLMRAG